MKPMLLGTVLFISIWSFSSSVAASTASEYFDKSEYSYIGDRLFQKDGLLYFQAEMPDVGKDSGSRFVYLKRFSYFDASKPHTDSQLSDVIDKDTWKWIAGNWYKDRNFLYCEMYLTPYPYIDYLADVSLEKIRFHLNGKWLSIEQVEQLSYCDKKRLSKYFKSEEKVYYRCPSIRGADPGTFEVLGDTDTFDAKDKFGFYETGRLIKR